MKHVFTPAVTAGLGLLMLGPPPALSAPPLSPGTSQSDASSPEYANLPNLGDVWSPEYLRDYYAYVVGPEIFDLETRDQFCEAAFFGGNTLRLWNEATDLKRQLLAASSLSGGLKVLLVGKFTQETGLLDTIRQLIGPQGALTTVDTTQDFLDGVRTPRAVLQRDFSFSHLPGGTFDRVILFSTVSQMRNLEESAGRLITLLKAGGRLVVAEDPVGGREFLAAIHMDTHMEAHTFRMMNGMGITEKDLPVAGVPEVARAFSRLTHTGSSAWLGLYTFHGQKQGDVEPYTLPTPVPGTPLADFLAVKPFKNPFAWMTARELAVWPLVADPRVRASCAYALFLGGGLHLIADLNEREAGTNRLMLDNLGLKKGARVLIISELLDEMGWYGKLERRTGFKMADADTYVYDIAQRVRSARTRSRFADDQPQDREAKSVFYYAMPDPYPDEYFDLIWMPQGCGHNTGWDDFMQRALRVLKTGGRLVMQEHDIQGADFWKACETVSILFRAIGEKEYLRNGALPVDDDVPLSRDSAFVLKPLKQQWEAAVGETLEYTSVFERGSTTFWGRKIPYPMADWWHGYPYMQRYIPKVRIPGR